MQFVLYWLLAWVLVESTRSSPLSGISLEDGTVDNNYIDDCNNQSITLDFSNIILFEIGDNFLASPLITCLNLRGNGINTISSSAFDKLPTLTYLDLSHNNLNIDNILSNGRHESLKTLILDRAFSSTEMALTGAYPSLEKLYVRNNFNLRRIRGSIKGDFSKLAYLYLSNNNIDLFLNSEERVEIVISHSSDYSWLPKSLKYLELDNNRLESLSLRDLPELAFLKINNNQLQTLSLYNLHELKEISTTVNNLREISLIKLNGLKYFSACDNKIEHLSYSQFQGTPNLEDLDLSNNQLSDFDGRIVDFIPNLQNLSLGNNQLTDVPNIKDAPTLQTLSLRCNKIKKIESNHFSGMPNLRILHLDNNEIAEINANSFSNLQKLEILSLGRNNLQNLPSQWMLKLQNLRFLHLEENQFTNLEALQLNDIPSLMQIFLQNNPLKYLRANSLDSVPENVTIELDTSLTTVKQCKEKKDASRRKRSYYKKISSNETLFPYWSDESDDSAY